MPSKNCETCRCWSELVAKAEAGVLKAMCTSPVSLLRGNYTSARQSCSDWAQGVPLLPAGTFAETEPAAFNPRGDR